MTGNDALKILEVMRALWPAMQQLSQHDAEVWVRHLRDVERTPANEVVELLVIEWKPKNGQPDHPGVHEFYQRYKAYMRVRADRQERIEREAARIASPPKPPEDTEKQWAHEHLQRARDNLRKVKQRDDERTEDADRSTSA